MFSVNSKAIRLRPHRVGRRQNDSRILVRDLKMINHILHPNDRGNPKPLYCCSYTLAALLYVAWHSVIISLKLITRIKLYKFQRCLPQHLYR